MTKEQKSNLDDTLEQIHKQFGDESIMLMGSSGLQVESISTGSYLLDKALGVGGLPKGRIIEVYGPESAGKSTLALHMLAEAQKVGRVAFIDAEHALDAEYAQKIGVDIEKMLISQPDCGEDALEIVDMLIRSGEIAMIVIDSVAALTPKAEIEGDIGQSHMGLQARLMSQSLRKIAGIASKSNTIVLFTNQLRDKIGVMFGNPETTTGGNALKFYASIRLDIRRIDKLKKGEDIIGNRVRIKVVKNKVAPPFKQVETSIIFGVGLDRFGEIADYLISKSIIEKAGAWFKYKEEKLQGRDAIVEYVRNNEKEFQKYL